MNTLEVRRQIFHIVNGTLILLAYSHWGRPVGWVLLVLSLAGAGLSLYHVKVSPIKWATPFLNALEREENILSFPGKGAVLYGLSVGLAIILFPPFAAKGAICALAYGDAFSTIVGKFLGRIAIPWNRSLSLEGSLAFIITTFMGGSFFVSYWHALLSGVVGALVETVPFVDDNLSIPLAVGLVLTVVG